MADYVNRSSSCGPILSEYTAGDFHVLDKKRKRKIIFMMPFKKKRHFVYIRVSRIKYQVTLAWGYCASCKATNSSDHLYRATRVSAQTRQVGSTVTWLEQGLNPWHQSPLETALRLRPLSHPVWPQSIKLNHPLPRQLPPCNLNSEVTRSMFYTYRVVSADRTPVLSHIVGESRIHDAKRAIHTCRKM